MQTIWLQLRRPVDLAHRCLWFRYSIRQKTTRFCVQLFDAQFWQRKIGTVAVCGIPAIAKIPLTKTRIFEELELWLSLMSCRPAANIRAKLWTPLPPPGITRVHSFHLKIYVHFYAKQLWPFFSISLALSSLSIQKIYFLSTYFKNYIFLVLFLPILNIFFLDFTSNVTHSFQF